MGFVEDGDVTIVACGSLTRRSIGTLPLHAIRLSIDGSPRLRLFRGKREKGLKPFHREAGYLHLRFINIRK